MKIIIVGSGIGGLGAACLLAKAGHDVTVLEKNADLGGRAGQFTEDGFTFNYGPSWYLMPEVFEHFYELLGEQIGDHLQLQKLSPYYRIFTEGSLLGPLDIYGDLEKDGKALERFESNAHEKLEAYLQECGELYALATQKFIYKNYTSPAELLTPGNFLATRKLNLLRTMDQRTGKYFLSEDIKRILGYAAGFVGASPYTTPAVYGLLNHALFVRGVFYPKGGMYSLVKSLVRVAEAHGVKFLTSSEVSRISVKNGRARGVVLSSGKKLESDVVISNAGLPATEQRLLKAGQRSYSSIYWQRKTTSPSAVLLYLGIKGDIPELAHHNFLFTSAWKKQFAQLKKSRVFPEKPSIYICANSKDDKTLSPKGTEGLYIVVPTPKNIPYTTASLQNFADNTIEEIASSLHIHDLKERIVYQKVFAGKDFAARYNAPRGTMLGLGHTFMQTGPFRPQNKSKKVEGLYYVGADTVPGIGVPICLISAELVAERVIKS